MQFKETVFLFLCSIIAFGQCLETSNQEQEIQDALKRMRIFFNIQFYHQYNYSLVEVNQAIIGMVVYLHIVVFEVCF